MHAVKIAVGLAGLMFGQVVSAQTWEPYAGVNEQVFSSYVIATATMKPTQLLTMSAAGAVISPKTLSSAEEQLEAALARQITTQSKSAGAEGSSDESHAEGGAAAEDQSKDSDDSEGQLDSVVTPTPRSFGRAVGVPRFSRQRRDGPPPGP